MVQFSCMENVKETFLWYDLETFGTNASYDRIAQFAAQRTDTDLNPVGSPETLYCKLSPDYFPDPGACLVTGITPQTVKDRGLIEYDFISRINRMMSVPGTCTVGFNNIRFDDEFIRNALYRNLMDPYAREYKNGCSRWDIIDLVRACHDFRPGRICWPPSKETGNPDFRLTSLTKANSIDQTGAHDAFVDVNATIAVAKLVKENEPRLFDYYLKLRDKRFVRNILNLHSCEALLHVNSIYTRPEGCTSLIVPLTSCTGQDNTIWFFDLRKDPAALITAPEEELAGAPGLGKLAANKCPFIAKTNTLDSAGYKRLGLDRDICMKHLDLIKQNIRSIIVKLRNLEPDYEPVDDPDFKIYSGFFPDTDKKLFSVVLATPPEQKLSLNFTFTDPRCTEMVLRHTCRNWPEKLSKEQLEEWKSFSEKRLTSPPVDESRSLKRTEMIISAGLNPNSGLDQDKKDVLLNLLAYDRSLRRYLGMPALSESTLSEILSGNYAG